MSWYYDASALVKLVRAEPESQALVRFIHSGEVAPMTSALGRLEVLRVASRWDAADDARAALRAVDVRVMSDRVWSAAESLAPRLELRSLDALHLAFVVVHPQTAGLVTYDHRMIAAAEAVGIRVTAPA